MDIKNPEHQQMAAIPEPEFERRIENMKRDPRGATTAKMLKPVPEAECARTGAGEAGRYLDENQWPVAAVKIWAAVRMRSQLYTGRKYLGAIATTLLMDNNRHMKVLGVRLAKVRRECGMTQELLAKKARLSLGYIARLEIGMHDPSVSTLLKLAKAMKVRPAKLLS